ncbi:MAG: hypothetical protein CMF72_22685 [Mameliella sp.]|nr:hypothetical protein [Mameliella sp.]|tara:strand:- start:996 stop:1181 length:186 start_codon:yes stop_codon:yes gene_type:complete
MALFGVEIKRDGYIKASDLMEILEGVTDELVDVLNEQKRRIDRLERDIETERRMRRSMKSR